MSNNCDLSCVVPAFNEEECVETMLTELTGVLDQRSIDYEIVLINNGSIDRTGEIVQTLIQKNKRIRMLHFKENVGYGGAIIDGLANAKGKILGFVTADGEVPPESVVMMYDIVRNSGVDLCKAKRIYRRDGLHRKIFSFSYHLFCRFLFRIYVIDVNGYPLFMTRPTYSQLNLTKKDWMINLDILYQVSLLDLVIAEVNVKHRKRLGGVSHVKWYTAIGMLIQVVRYFFSRRLAAVNLSLQGRGRTPKATG